MNAGPPVRVMLCDDSAVIRAALARMLEADPAIQVVARAGNGQVALDELTRLARAGQGIDVLVLDIEMPVMDGLTALPLLLAADPGLKIIMASTLTTRGADIALRALQLGAADYVPKPDSRSIGDDSFRRELLARVHGLGRLRRGSLPAARPAPSPATALPPPPRRTELHLPPRLPPRLLAIGSSTGGPPALFTLVKALGPGLPVPVVLTQHMPATFTALLAEHLTRLGAMPCVEATDGAPLLPGRIHIAPGDHHLLVEASGSALRARITRDPPENYCRPSVDPMLRSANAACAGRVLVVMLTGMGQDGLLGTRAVVEAGGSAIAQDEATSVVWGMPGAVARAGLCREVLPLPAIAPAILRQFGPHTGAAPAGTGRADAARASMARAPL